MSSSNQVEKSYEENISEYYEKLGKIEKISITDSKLLERLKNTDISKYHPLLSAYESMSAGDETTSWDNYKYKTQ
tara:strand:+ start:4211 stop:4435 length:225 start_codon:yes stop_codon:yes gene_type:complete